MEFVRRQLAYRSNYYIRSSDNAIIPIVHDRDVYNHFNDKTSYALFIMNQINNDKIYDRFLSHKTGLTILDIGANVGMFSLYASSSAAKIISIEPTPKHNMLLRKITASIPQVNVIQCALTNEDCVIPFYIHPTNSTENSIVNHSGLDNNTIMVYGKKLKTILDESRITNVDFCKIDIEGSEMTALTRETISEVASKIKSFFIEIHPTGDSSIHENREHLISIFKENNYAIEVLQYDTIYCYSN
jgi:FkbM family methyltransferase